MNEFLQKFNILIQFYSIVIVFIRQTKNGIIAEKVGLGIPFLFFSVKGDGRIQSDAIHPSGIFIIWIVLVEGIPQLDNDFLLQIFPIPSIWAIRIHDFIDDLFVFIYQGYESVFFVCLHGLLYYSRHVKENHTFWDIF